MDMSHGYPPALHIHAGDGAGDWYPPLQATCTRLHPHTLSLFLVYMADGTSIPGSKTEGEILGCRIQGWHDCGLDSNGATWWPHRAGDVRRQDDKIPCATGRQWAGETQPAVLNPEHLEAAWGWYCQALGCCLQEICACLPYRTIWHSEVSDQQKDSYKTNIGNYLKLIQNLWVQIIPWFKYLCHKDVV